MNATAITYSTDGKRSHLRTVIVSDVRSSTVLLPSAALDVVMAKHLHGSHCAHSFWDEVLGTQDDDFAVPAAQVVARRPMQISAKPRYRGVIADDGRTQLKRGCD
jgi:hypothetical protein